MSLYTHLAPQASAANQTLPDEAPTAVATAQREVAFVDTSVADWQTLVDGIRPGVEVVLLDGDSDGLAQMAAWAQSHSGYDAVHVFSHGSSGRLTLGAASLDSTALETRSADLALLGGALKDDGDILLYGCSVGADGAFVEKMTELTQADIAASTDPTGAAALGGDWSLEVSSGLVGTNAWSFGAYQWLLPTTAYSGTLTTDNTYHRPWTPFDIDLATPPVTESANTVYTGAQITQTSSTSYNYAVATFVPSATGTFTFAVTAANIAGASWDPADVFMAIYEGSFTSTSPLVNLLWANDDTDTDNGNYKPTIPSKTLTAGTSYIVVMTSYDAGLTGTFTFSVDGPSGGTWTAGAVAAPSPPTLAATGATPTFTQGDASGVDLYSSVTAATNDSGQTFSGAVLTVTNVADTSEYLTIGGTDVALTHGASGSFGSGIGNYSVSVSSGTATVTLSGMTRSDAEMGTLIDGIAYKSSDASVTAGNRVITLTTVTDSGGSNNSTTVNRQATVSVAIPANNAPTISDVANQTIDENAATSTLAVTVGDSETAAGSLTLSGTSSDTTLIPNGSIVLGGSGANRTVTITPAADKTGTATITLTVTDGNGATATDTLSVTVSDVDPTISNATLSVAENSANGTAVGTVSASNDTNGLSYAITAGNTGTAFAIDASTGAITVADSTQLNYEGTSSYNLTITVDDEDADTTADSTATITVNLSNVNEAPANTKPATQTTNEDTALVFSAGNGNALSVTDADAGTTLTTVVSVGSGTGTLAVATGGGGTISGNGTNSVQIVGTVAQVQNALGTVTYTPTANASGNGYATLTIQSTDNGTGTLSDTDTVTINVTAIADTPSVTDTSTTPATQTASGLVLTRNAADSTEVTHFKITGITNGNLFKNDGTTAITNGTFITYAEGNAGLKFTPTGGGNGSFTAQASTSAADGGLGGATVNAAIAVGAAVASPTIAEDTASTAIAITLGGAETCYRISSPIIGGELYRDAAHQDILYIGDFIGQGEGGGNATTTYVHFVPTANRNGTHGGNGSFALQANNDSGDIGSPITSTITLTPVADTPSVTGATAPGGMQSTTGLVLSRSAVDSAETTHFKITGITGGTLYKNDGTTAIANGTFITYAEGNAGLKFTPSGNDNGSFTAQASTSAADGGLGGSTVTATTAVTVPAITGATYNATTGVLSVTGSNFLTLAGAANDIDTGKLTITGEGGATYTLTDTADVEITSGTAFTLTLSATDKAGVNALVSKTGTASNDNTTYNLAAAEDWAAGAASVVNVADLTGNGITATVNSAPAITSNGGGTTAAVSVAENATVVTTVTATDADSDTPTFSISGGTDQAKFTINATSGALSFASAPDFETPTDGGANNTYAVEVTASDGNGETDIQTITVTVTDVGESSGGGDSGGSSTPSTPTTTTTTTPPVAVDGTTVSTTTVTAPVAGGTRITMTETVAPVAETRQEDTSTEHHTLADIPLATDGSGETLLQVSLPVGVGLTSQTISGSGNTLRELLIAASDPKVEQATVFDQILSHGIDAYVPTVLDEQQVTVRTITFSETAAVSGQTIVVTGALGTGENNAQAPLRQEALVVDTRSLPAASTLDFNNVEFAIVIGAVNLTGGNGRNFVIGDEASQHMVLGADDDELHGGGGNDYVGSKGGDDKLYGDEGDDTVSGGDGDDVLEGGAGTDFVLGCKDVDSVGFAGAASRYEVSYDFGKTVVRSLDDAADVDTLVNVETLRFADQSIDVTPHTTDLSWIATLYRQVLGRQADLDGFQYWAHDAALGQSRGDIALNFLRAGEHGGTFDTLDASAKIECLYTDLLGRQSESAGKENWLLQYANGMSMAEIARNFIDSAELVGQYLAPQGWDFYV